MAKVTKQPVMNPEYKYVLELSEDEAHQLVALLGGSSGVLFDVFDVLDDMLPYRKYEIDCEDVPSLVRTA